MLIRPPKGRPLPCVPCRWGCRTAEQRRAGRLLPPDIAAAQRAQIRRTAIAMETRASKVERMHSAAASGTVQPALPPGHPNAKRKKANTPLQTEVYRGVLVEDSGSVLLSQTVSRQVPLALESLTSEFGMESGGTSPLWPPEIVTRLAMTPSSGAPFRGSERSAAFVAAFQLPWPTPSLHLVKGLAGSTSRHGLRCRSWPWRVRALGCKREDTKM